MPHYYPENQSEENLQKPKLGAIKKGIDIGRNYHSKFMWDACIDCGKQRWVKLLNGKPAHSRCNVCTCQLKQINWHPQDWRLGTVRQKGYVSIRIDKDDFFYPMARKTGYVFEHRLVVAKALGRCLHRWEIVHHKKGYAKDDNRYPQTLQLVSDARHNQITILETRISYLERRVTLIEAENVVLRECENANH